MSDENGGGAGQVEIEGLNEWAFGNEGDQIETWVYRLDDSGQRPGRGGDGRPAYFRKLYGDIDPEIVRRECGGGEFELKVHVNRKIRKTVKISVLGPRLSDEDVSRMTQPEKTGAPAAPEPPAPAAIDPAQLAAAIGSAVVQSLAPVLERIASSSVRQEPARDALTIDQMLSLMDRMRPNAPDATSLVKMQTDMLTRGIELANRATGEGRSLGDAIVETMPSLVETVDKMLAARQANIALSANTRPVAAAPDNRSGAAPPSAPAQQNVTNLVLAGQVASAIANQVQPEDFADMLETLYGAEAAKIASVDAATIAGVLRPFAAQFPVLGTEQLQPYVQAVLHELANPPASETSASAGSEA